MPLSSSGFRSILSKLKYQISGLPTPKADHKDIETHLPATRSQSDSISPSGTSCNSSLEVGNDPFFCPLKDLRGFSSFEGASSLRAVQEECRILAKSPVEGASGLCAVQEERRILAKSPVDGMGNV